MCEDNNEAASKIRLLLQAQKDECIGEEELLQHLKFLRNLCAYGGGGGGTQTLVATHPDLNSFLHNLLFESDGQHRLRSMAFQLLANAIVNNAETQKAVWTRHGEAIVRQCSKPTLDRCTDIQLMIMYNVLLGREGSSLLTDQMAFRTIVHVWQRILSEKCDSQFDFLHLFFEYFLVQQGRTTVRCYAHLESSERIAFLDYVSVYLRQNSDLQQNIHSFLLQYISKEFKIKSDCILRQTAARQEQHEPREAYALLRIIASASGSESYEAYYKNDHSLFLNVSSLLRCLVAVGKESATKNIFTPMNKLEQVCLTSNISHDFESEVSFELKTLLVRSIANLLYKNKTNQGYCLDTQLMPALFECTNMDARNPLMKEWSILAIRNACIDCPELQQVIANLTKQTVVQNDIMSELNLDMGSLRIQASKE